MGTRVLVIGGGPAGYGAAFRAADLGLEVTLVDLDKNPGGTCLYRGCIPSKALLHVAKVIHEAREAEHVGLYFEPPRIDIDKVRQSAQDVVSKMTGGLGQLSKARKVTLVQGRATFLASDKVRVELTDGGAEILSYDYCILATGSVPSTLPHLDIGSDRVMDSTGALALESVPERLLIIGGGYIGLELTTVYAALGSKCTVVDFAPGILMGADPDLIKPLAKRMEDLCEVIHVNTKVLSIEDTGSAITATLEGPGIENPVQEFDKVLVSVGRRPKSDGLGLENTKVVINDQGFVDADHQMRTADPKIFAVGDLIGQPMLAHKGTAEGRVAAEVIAGEKSSFDAKCIPAVVFTDPEVAWVGITETEAKAQGMDVKIGAFPWAASGRATTLGRPDGLTKIIADPDTDQILGMGIVGAGAGELIAEGALAIEMGANATDIALTIHPHPTLNESIMEAAELLHGSSTHLYRKPRKK
jgi:dihydrolipoyl dehydrogenase